LFLIILALEVEGLFRIPGSADEIEAMITLFDAGKQPDLSRADPHAVAGVLKVFIRKLPEQIPQHSNAALNRLLSSTSDKEFIKSEIKAIITAMPPPWQNLLKALANFFSRLSEKHSLNKMNVDVKFLILIF
jgi:RalA-binding protein 1